MGTFTEINPKVASFLKSCKLKLSQSNQKLLNILIQGFAYSQTKNYSLASSPRSLFILRNNDIGDLLVITPLFQALRDRFPDTHIAVGVGDWNQEILKNNPYIDEIISINAPWFNKVIPQQNIGNILNYLAFSPEVKTLQQKQFEVGIDILGSPWGALLLLKAEIPYRLGVKGFAGGETAMQACVTYNPQEKVGRSALRFAELLGAENLPESRPQIFLNPSEVQMGKNFWQQFQGKKRVIIAPGSGTENKYWPLDYYKQLVTLLSQKHDLAIAIVGGKGDREAGCQLQAVHPKIIDNTGKNSLRETFALINAANIVISNSSMTMHAAAAFAKPMLVLLGNSFPSVRQHDVQWGYDCGYYSLGKEIACGRDRIATPEEVINLLIQLL